MPLATAFSAGVANGNSVALLVPLPEIERSVVVIDSISVIRSLGRLLTDGDAALVGLSHQTDILTTELLDDPDDFLQDNGYDLWWVHGLSETDHVQDRLDHPEVVAGPQGFIAFNGTGATCAFRIDVSFHTEQLRNIQEWTLLKIRSSYERRQGGL